jgi:YjbE family integral membrane protein
MFEMLADQLFWIGLGQIVLVNIVLSGDNAVVIALAARTLPAHQQKKAVFWGSGAAVVLRIVFTVVTVEILKLAYVKLVGAALLVWIAVRLLLPEAEDGEHLTTGNSLASAIKIILVADLVMSLDNVIAVAAAARGSLTLLIIGLVLSVPLVIFGSTLLLKVMDRFPIIVTVGAGLLGWVAGEMAVTDLAIRAWVDASAPWLHYGAPAIGALSVVWLGHWLARRAQRVEAAQHELVDLAPQDQRSKAPR